MTNTDLEKFQKEVEQIHNTQIQFLAWNGRSQPCKYRCPACGQTHYTCHAYILLQHKNICADKWPSERPLTEQSYKQFLETKHPNKVDMIHFNGIGKEVTFQCKTCSTIFSITKARKALEQDHLCPFCDGPKKKTRREVYTLLKTYKQYELLSWSGIANEKIFLRCRKCGAEFQRYPVNFIRCPDSCPECNNQFDKQRKPLAYAQRQLDEKFGKGVYTLLSYHGALDSHSRIKCNECGHIFETCFSALINQSRRGCPRCKRHQSVGEQQVSRLLEEFGIPYEAQKRFPDCNGGLSSFDFYIERSDGQKYVIEVNGIQHYSDGRHWGKDNSLEDNIRRDAIKQEYCEETGINLIVIPYWDLTEEKIREYLSILSSSTTISGESKE